MPEQDQYIATIHSGMWEIHPYNPNMLQEIRRVNRQNPGEIELLGIFPSKAQAEEICARHVPTEQHQGSWHCGFRCERRGADS